MASSTPTSILSEHGKQNEPQCARCKKPASPFCRGCDEATMEQVTPPKTYYCSTERQKAHRPTHKQYCDLMKRQKQLHRAAHFLQAALYVYRERTFDVSIEKVERRENEVHVWEGEYGPTQSLIAFPNHLARNREENEALLAMLTCNDQLIDMGNLICLLLGASSFKVEEACVTPKNHHRKVTFLSRGPLRDNSQVKHFLLKVSIKGGSMYALDITSAQYGYHAPLSHWDEYLDTRVANVCSINPFGSLARQMSLTQPMPFTLYSKIIASHQLSTRVFNEEVEKWLTGEKMTLKELLALREPAYREKKEAFRVMMDGKLAGFIDTWEQSFH